MFADSFTYDLSDGTRVDKGVASVLVYGQPNDGDDLLDVTAQAATQWAAPGCLPTTSARV